MRSVLVTGGIGLVGKAVVTRLLATGYAVRILDRKTEAEARAVDGADVYAGAAYAQGDINDYADLLEKVRGCDLIVHMAALASPGMGTPQEVFRVNAAGTFNVFRAAEELGIRRVVQASSINAIGLYYGVKPAEPLYFPIDEDHPPQDTDAYSFSKWVVEEIAEYYWRRAGISSVSLRYPSVLPARAQQWITRRKEGIRKTMEKMQGMSEAERRAWLDAFLAEMKELRVQKKMEDMEFQRSLWGPNPPLSEEKRWFMGARNNFWTLIDDRDAAQAVEKGLTADYEGAHPLFVNDKENSAQFESEALLRMFFPLVTARKRALVGNETLVSIDKARKLIGFEPEYSFA